MQEPKIAYEPHPVTPERVAELQAEGFQIIDAIFKPADAQEAEADKPKRGRPAKAQEAE